MVINLADSAQRNGFLAVHFMEQVKTLYLHSKMKTRASYGMPAATTTFTSSVTGQVLVSVEACMEAALPYTWATICLEVAQPLQNAFITSHCHAIQTMNALIWKYGASNEKIIKFPNK